MAPEITGVELTAFSYPIEDIGTDGNGFNLVYEPGSVHDRKMFGLKIHTDVGVTGEYVAIAGFGENGPVAAQVNMMADYLLGKNPLDRERHWSELQRGFRKYDRMGVGPIDITLWDLAGKLHDTPIHELLGSYRRRLPTYASTYMGDENGGLDSPEAYADFAEECLERGFPGFKMHGWGGSDASRDVGREIETVHALGDRVGDEMHLMLDPACEYETFTDALEVGRACDEAGFYWYEDPYRDGGYSQHGHRKLGQFLDTPILQGEHIRGLQIDTDLMANDGTDLARADPEYDGGITGAMKVAHVAEGFGLDCEIHSSGPAHRHCVAAMRNTNYYELAVVGPHTKGSRELPVYADGYQDGLDAVDDDGTVPVPEGPGLGVEYDWDYVEENKIGEWVHE